MAHASDPDPVFKALADGARRRILEGLADGARPVNAIAEGFAISRPAVSKHLRVLLDAGLVSVRREGKQMLYALEREALAATRAWIDGFWDDRLAALKRLAEGDA